MTTATIIEAPTAARAAALWWAEQIGAPIFRNTSERDSLQDQRNGDFAGMMQSLLAATHPVDEAQGSKFADLLEQHIAAQLEGRNWGVTLGVDYGPDLPLAQVAEAAGINPSRFPWKTHVSVHTDYVIASLGYGSRPRLIWSAPGWQRPACGSQRYEKTRDAYECYDEVCPKPRYHEDDCGDWVPDAARCTECGGSHTAHFGRGVHYPGHVWSPTLDGAR